MQINSANLKSVIIWGTFDFQNSRIKNIYESLKLLDIQTTLCHEDIWKKLPNRYQLFTKPWKVFLFVPYVFFTYLKLTVKFLNLPPHTHLLIAHPGLFDALVITKITKLKGLKIIFENHLWLYEMLVDDRNLIKKNSFAAKMINSAEKYVFRNADIIITDTKKHLEDFCLKFPYLRSKTFPVWVGCDTQLFRPLPKSEKAYNNFKVIFYGEFIPLHGIDVIIKAFSIIDKTHPNITLTLIGRGQEKEKIETLMKDLSLQNITWIDWIQFENLPHFISKNDIGLGIFGSSSKAKAVIPHKVFQMLSCGLPIITQDSKAIREWLYPGEFIKLISPTPEALASTIIELSEAPRDLLRISGYEVGPFEIKEQLVKVFL